MLKPSQKLQNKKKRGQMNVLYIPSSKEHITK